MECLRNVYGPIDPSSSMRRISFPCLISPNRRHCNWGAPARGTEMIGWLLNTLSYRLRSELRDWRKANQSLSKNAWPLYQRALVSAGEHPLWFPLRLFLVVIGDGVGLQSLLFTGNMWLAFTIVRTRPSLFYPVDRTGHYRCNDLPNRNRLRGITATAASFR